MDNKLITGIIGVVVVVALLGSALVPVIDSIAGGVEYEDNPDWDGWVRFDLNTSADAMYRLEMSQDDNGIYVENIAVDSRDMQIYDDSTTVEYPTIMYADSNMVVWSIDDTFNVMGKINGSPVFVNAPILDITRGPDGVEVVTDTDSYLFDAPTWAYVPLSQGKYGFYPFNEDRGVEHPTNAPTAVLGGGFAGVWAYNNSYRYDGLDLAMNPIIEDGLYYGATWEKQAADAGELNPDDITITPLDPSDITITPLNPGMELMGTVPTPTYTDGDWGYDVKNGYAVIVSYSGAGGDVVVPSTVGGYTVQEFGKGTTGNSVFESTVPITDLVLPSTILSINDSACGACTGITGSLVIPSSVTSIGSSAFNGCTGITGSLVIPSSVTSIALRAFKDCSGITSLVLSDNLTAIPNYAFQNCSGLTGSLVIPSSVTSIGTSAFNGCTGITGSLVIPSSVTSIGNTAFNGCSSLDAVVVPSSVTSIGTQAFLNCSNADNLVIASDATPGNAASFSMTGLVEVLDLSDSIDYSVDRYGIPAAAEVSDSIGDCFGFVSIVTTEHGSSGALGGAAALLYAIPVVIIAAMLVAGVGWFIGKRY